MSKSSSRVWTIAKREFSSYFSSPVAFIFLLTYLGASLYTFFVVEQFFARNIADIKPLFTWMPVLLIFLIATLTMRSWSEERSTGTVEFLRTLPVTTLDLVMGKFWAMLGLVGIALGLTLALPISIATMGPLDWGPVVGGYLASLLLAAAYVSIGLFVSSRFESQIVSLIVTVLVCGAFFVLGSDYFRSFFGNDVASLLASVGTGSRFESISRGVLDLRDICYYASLSGVFLVLNVWSIQELGWAKESAHSRAKIMTALTALLCGNFVSANLWMAPIHKTRIDMTQKSSYSVSEASRQLMDQLEEPLMVKGFFSNNTHPLLAPVVPMVKDFLTEYQLASNDRVKVEFIDPQQDPEIEAEVSRRYSIEPVPLQEQDRHSARLVSTYFNIVVQYGDKFEVLGLEDLLDIRVVQAGTGLNVSLRNIEYDVTRAARKVVQSFTASGDLYARLSSPVTFVAYVSETGLPSQIRGVWRDMKKAAEQMAEKSAGKLSVRVADPTADPQLAEQIYKDHGFAPQRLSILARDTFYFYLTLQTDGKVLPIEIEGLEVEKFRKSLEEGLQRMGPGFLKTVGVYTPPGGGMNPMMMQFGGGGGEIQFRELEKKISEGYATTSVDLNSGTIPSDVDVLLLLAPKELSSKQIFAVDQFLMKGGSVILATGPSTVSASRSGISRQDYRSGLGDWLTSFGLSIGENFVADLQSAAFPEIVQRNVGGAMVNQVTTAPYPLLVDLRPPGLNPSHSLVSGLGQLTMAWGSPITYTAAEGTKLAYTALAESSPKSWRTEDKTVAANRAAYPALGFAQPDHFEKSTLVAMLEGEFTSFFKGKPSPLMEDSSAGDVGEGKPKKKDEKSDASPGVVTGVIEKSPMISRLVLIASNDFVSDQVLNILHQLQGARPTQQMQLVQNALDWSTEDRGLLALRSKGMEAATLLPMSDDTKVFWEWFNFALVLAGLGAVFGVYSLQRRRLRQAQRASGLIPMAS